MVRLSNEAFIWFIYVYFSFSFHLYHHLSLAFLQQFYLFLVFYFLILDWLPYCICFFILLMFVYILFQLFECTYKHPFDFFLRKFLPVIFIRCHYYEISDLCRKCVILNFHVISVSILIFVHLELKCWLNFFFKFCSC